MFPRGSQHSVWFTHWGHHCLHVALLRRDMTLTLAWDVGHAVETSLSLGERVNWSATCFSFRESLRQKDDLTEQELEAAIIPPSTYALSVFPASLAVFSPTMHQSCQSVTMHLLVRFLSYHHLYKIRNCCSFKNTSPSAAFVVGESITITSFFHEAKSVYYKTL